jgi:hypothetical protein
LADGAYVFLLGITFVCVAASAGPHPAQDVRRAGWDVLYFNCRGANREIYSSGGATKKFLKK